MSCDFWQYISCVFAELYFSLPYSPVCVCLVFVYLSPIDLSWQAHRSHLVDCTVSVTYYILGKSTSYALTGTSFNLHPHPTHSWFRYELTHIYCKTFYCAIFCKFWADFFRECVAISPVQVQAFVGNAPIITS